MATSEPSTLPDGMEGQSQVPKATGLTDTRGPVTFFQLYRKTDKNGQNKHIRPMGDENHTRIEETHHDRVESKPYKASQTEQFYGLVLPKRTRFYRL